jgi:hypothetical protein
MRHWLAGVLAQEQPALFRDLPDSYKVGAPLPPQPLSRPKKMRKKHLPPSPKWRGRTHHFVHGCELLAL